MYKYLNDALSTFNVDTEYSTNEALAVLRKHLANNLEFGEGLRKDIEQALNDQTFSWKDAFIAHQCELLFTYDETEEEVRAYAKNILWDELFAA